MGTWVGGDGGVGVGSVVAGGRVGYRGLVGAEVDAVDAADAMETRCGGGRGGRDVGGCLYIHGLRVGSIVYRSLFVRSCGYG